MRYFVLSTALAMVLMSTAYAQTTESCTPSPDDRSENQTEKLLKNLLKSKNFSAVENELNARLKRYVEGRYSDLSLLILIDKTATAADPSLEPILQQWVAERPNQLMARLVKASYHIDAGYARRGTSYIAATSVEQLSAMKADFDKASVDAEVALNINPESSLARAMLISISRATTGRETTLKWLKESEKLDPLNQSARWAAITALDPRWGGRPEDLALIESQIMQSPLHPSARRGLLWSVAMTRADYFYDVTKESAKALEHYRAAAKICVSSDAAWKISDIAYSVKDWGAVIEAVTNYMSIRPLEARAFSRRGWAKENINRMHEALLDYEKAASLGDDWAQYKMGYLLLSGKYVEKDVVKGIRLMEAAAAKGNATAETYLNSFRGSRGQ